MIIDFSKMSLREKVLQTCVVTAREINRHGGPKEFFEKYPVGGMYVAFNDKLEGTVETGILCSRKRYAECRRYSKYPLLVCCDDAKAKGQLIGACMEAVSASGSEEIAYLYGKVVGMQLNDNGIDWLLGPCIDMHLDPAFPLFGWGDDAETIAKLGGAFVQGLQDQGVCATIKHFPGNGTDAINMHLGAGRNSYSFEKWMETYGYIYKSIIDKNTMSVMTTHVTLESCDNELHDGRLPIATYSKKLTQELLKNKLGFDNAVVTDALCMGGMATGDYVNDVAMAFKCGADLLLFPQMEAVDRIVEMLESGEIPMSRLDDALARINKMREFRANALKNKVAEPTDLKFLDESSEKIKEAGICLLRNQRNLIPLDKKIKNILIVDAATEEKYAKFLQEELAKHGISSDIKKDVFDLSSWISWQDEIDALVAQYDFVIFNMNVDYLQRSSMDMLIWTSHMVDKDKKLLINYTGAPYFAPIFFSEDPTYIEVNCQTSKEISKALVEKILGIQEFTGVSRLKYPKSTIKVFN